MWTGSYSIRWHHAGADSREKEAVVVGLGHVELALWTCAVHSQHCVWCACLRFLVSANLMCQAAHASVPLPRLHQKPKGPKNLTIVYFDVPYQDSQDRLG